MSEGKPDLIKKYNNLFPPKPIDTMMNELFPGLHTRLEAIEKKLDRIIEALKGDDNED